MRHQRFAVTGVANVLTLDAGLESTKARIRTIKNVLVSVSDYKDNIVEVWVESDMEHEVPDYNFDTWTNDGDTNTPYSTSKILRLPIDRKLEIGEKLQIGIRCGANATNLRGSYEYEEEKTT